MVSFIINLRVHIFRNYVRLISFVGAIRELNFIFSGVKQRINMCVTDGVSIQSPGPFDNTSTSFIIGSHAHYEFYIQILVNSFLIVIFRSFINVHVTVFIKSWCVCIICIHDPWVLIIVDVIKVHGFEFPLAINDKVRITK